MSVLSNATLISASAKLLLVCACLVCAGTHTELRAQPAPTQETLQLVSADTTRGIELYQQGNIDEAIKLLKKASKETPGDVNAWQFLGLAYKQQGDQKSARKALETAVYLRLSQLSPRRLMVVNREPAPSKEELTAMRAEQLQRYRAALETLEAYLQLDPKDAVFWREQMETLQFYIARTEQPNSADSIYAPAELTTKAVILAKPNPGYTEEARLRRTGGRIALRLVLAADGTVQHILVLRPLPDGLTVKAVEAARRISFQPAMKDGRPVAQIVNVEYGFNIF